MPTISYLDLINSAQKRINQKRIDVTRSDLLKLLAHKYLHCSVQKLRLARRQEFVIAEPVYSLFQKDIDKLLAEWPFAYVIGETDFFDASYKCCPGVLIPRPDSEVLVEECLEALGELHSRYSSKSLSVCEIGVGSGALLAALASHFLEQEQGEPHLELKLFATDINPLALSLTKENLSSQNIKAKLYNCDLLPELEQAKQTMSLPFDILYSNPPYISAEEWPTLAKSVREYEPKTALLALEDGLAIYRRILDIAPAYIRQGSYLIFEHGYSQKQALTKLLQVDTYAMYKIKKWRKDYHGQDRVIVIQYSPLDDEN